MTAMKSRSRCPACGRRETRSTQANRRYWQLLSEASEKLRPAGVAYSVDQFHAYYKLRFLGGIDFALPNGQTLTEPNSTADLEPEDFAVYMQQVETDLAQRGVWLEQEIAA